MNKNTSTLFLFLISIIILTTRCTKEQNAINCPNEINCQNELLYNDTNSILEANEVLTVFVDQFGLAYFKTRNQTNYKFDFASKEMVIQDPKYMYDGITGGHVTDEHQGKLIYSCYGSVGGVIIDSESDIIVYDKNNSPLTGSHVIMAKYLNSELWISQTRFGVFVLADNKWRSFEKSDYQNTSPTIEDMAVDSKGNVWMTSNFGLYQVKEDTIIYYSKSDLNIPSDNLSDIRIDSHDNIYIASPHGLLIYDGKFQLKDTSNSNIPSNHVTSITISKENVVYIGTKPDLIQVRPLILVGGGIGVLYENNFTTINTKNSTLPYNHVNSIALGKHGEIYCGTQYGLFITCQP